MHWLSPLLVSVVLVGCTTTPMAPNIAVYATKGLTLEHDQTDNERCRQFAAAQIGAGTGSAACGAAMGTGQERQERYDHTSTVWMSASAPQVPGSPVR
jgi:hypothetical protein